VFWRRRLPRWIPADSIVFVTWRLAGALPQPEPAILMNDPHAVRTFPLQDRSLYYGERVRASYDLFAWAVMPNHVHIVLKRHEKLPEVVRWMKTASAARANRLTGRTGQPFWQREYFDTWMRTSQELASVIAYVEENPVSAGLALRAQDWPWSSASKYTGGETAGAPKMQEFQTRPSIAPNPD
jgi:REP element-mobilizing transposase RayT